MKPEPEAQQLGIESETDSFTRPKRNKSRKLSVDLSLSSAVTVKLEALFFCRSCFIPLENISSHDYEQILTKLQEILQFLLPPVPEAPGFCETCSNHISSYHEFMRHISAKQQKFLETGNISEIHLNPILDPLEEAFIKTEEDTESDVIKYENPKETQNQEFDIPEDENVHQTEIPRERNRLIKFEGKPTFICDVCGYKTLHRCYLRSHFRKVHVERNFACTQCDYRAKYEGRLINHRKRIHEKDTYIKKEACKPCPECGRLFVREMDLKNHVDRIHKKIKTVPCDFPECVKFFFCKGELLQHTKNNHGMTRLVCEVCGKSYPSPSLLKRHRILHDLPEDQFVCHCGAKFKTKLKFNAHTERVHLNLRNFKCSFCDKKFYRKGELRNHMLKHEGIKFQCPVPECTSAVTRKSVLVFHLKNNHSLTVDEMNTAMEKLNAFCKEIGSTR